MCLTLFLPYTQPLIDTTYIIPGLLISKTFHSFIVKMALRLQKEVTKCQWKKTVPGYHHSVVLVIGLSLTEVLQCLRYTKWSSHL